MLVQALVDELGRPVVEKRAGSPDEARRLRREADLLEVAAHPGLVELISIDDAPEPRLRTSRVEGRVLGAVHQLELEELAGVVAALASTLADLHEMSLVHAAVTPEHVVVDEDGRPVLCSLGYGGLVGERPTFVPSTDPTYVDPVRAEDERLDPAIDVFGLGALLSAFLVRSQGQNRRATAGGEMISRLAERATAKERSDRPRARELADALHEAVPGARLPRGAEAPPSVPPARELESGVRQQPLEGWRRAHVPVSPRPVVRHRRLLVTGVTAIAAVGVLAMLLRPSGRQRSPLALDVPDVPAPTEAPAPALPEEPPARAAEPVRGGCAPVDAPMTADVDRDGCAETVRFLDGVVETGGTRWSAGQPGDLAAVGDWACAGSRSLAVLRPSTGEVFAFDGWAAPGLDLHAPLLARVEGARAVRAADLDGDGCHEMVVERATGAPTVLQPHALRAADPAGASTTTIGASRSGVGP